MIMSDPNPKTAPTRVLVAEDDPTTGRALVFLLQRHHYEVLLVEDGQSALDMLMGADPPAIALLDWEMPRLDGLNVTRVVRSIAAAHYTYLIMVTARDAPADVLAAFAAGVDDFLSKPVDSAQLRARLRVGERVLALEGKLSARVAELERSLDEVRQLKRLLPICMYCKKVRDVGDYWQEIETYIHEHTGTNFSHGVCPDCVPHFLNQGMPGNAAEQRAD